MELRHFRYFAAVARYLNYSEASRRLHVAQPAISQTILDLEEEIGARLFLRSKHKVQLTAAGAALLGDVEAILKRAASTVRLRRSTVTSSI
jgi:DNA-binding transcriptional LysR family regulator